LQAISPINLLSSFFDFTTRAFASLGAAVVAMTPFCRSYEAAATHVEQASKGADKLQEVGFKLALYPTMLLSSSISAIRMTLEALKPDSKVALPQGCVHRSPRDRGLSGPLEQRDKVSGANGGFSMKQMLLAGLLTFAAVSTSASSEVPDAIAVSGESLVARLHAEGVQTYDCKAGASGQLAWQFREPIATLIEGGKTVGHHYAGPQWEAGPHWELTDGSIVAGKIVGQAMDQRPN
jgi:hypothetical protein